MNERKDVSDFQKFAAHIIHWFGLFFLFLIIFVMLCFMLVRRGWCRCRTNLCHIFRYESLCSNSSLRSTDQYILALFFNPLFLQCDATQSAVMKLHVVCPSVCP